VLTHMSVLHAVGSGVGSGWRVGSGWGVTRGSPVEISLDLTECHLGYIPQNSKSNGPRFFWI